MFSTVLSATLHGLCVELVDVEADSCNGLPMFQMVGYLSSEVKEAGERVKTAIRNTGIMLPAKKMTVNLSPASVRKKGTMFDLPIAIALLCSLGELSQESLKEILIVGELGLDGSVKQVPGVLPIVFAAKERGCKVCIVPKENEREGKLVNGIEVVGVSSLQEACMRLQTHDFTVEDKLVYLEGKTKKTLDFADVRGQHLAKRAIEVAVAGNHGILLIGPPGGGKSMMAKRIPTILPPLSMKESMELTKIYSIVGELDLEHPHVMERPFREVNPSITKCALIGGGKVAKPGEISLAHMGVLFLDEIAEFQKSTLEALRVPLQDHRIKIHREWGEYEFPANFLMVAAMNPCPCGNFPDLNRCTCTPSQIQAYLGKISQPLLDRIDMCVEVECVQYDDLHEDNVEESSLAIQERVTRAREIQAKRYGEMGIFTNSQLSPKQVRQFCAISGKEEEMMKQAFDRMQLTARKYYKILMVARTIADLDGSEQIQMTHLREALSYRMIDKKYWGGIV